MSVDPFDKWSRNCSATHAPRVVLVPALAPLKIASMRAPANAFKTEEKPEARLRLLILHRGKQYSPNMLPPIVPRLNEARKKNPVESKEQIRPRIRLT